MKDEYKTKEQLLEELKALRRQVTAATKAGRSNATGGHGGNDNGRSGDLVSRSTNGRNAHRIGRNVDDCEKSFRTLFELSKDPIYLAQTNGGIAEANASFLRFFGYSRAEVPKLSTKQLFPNPKERLRYEQEFATRGTLHDFELRFRTKDKQIRIGLLSCQALRSSDGVVIGYQGLIRDVTDQKRAEKAVRESVEKYRMVVQNSNEAILILQNGAIKLCNPKTAELTGYSLDELTLKLFLKLVHEEDQQMVVDQLSKKRRAVQQPAAHTVRLVDKSNKVKWIEFTSSLIQWDGVPATLCFLKDITEQRHLQQQLARAQRLETAGRVAGQIAHDFNNLLSPLAAYPTLIGEELGSGHPVIEMLDEMADSASKIAEINQQLLALGRRGHYTMEPVDLNKLVHKVVSSRNLPGDTVVKERLASNLFLITGGTTQLSRALDNLILNAVEAMHAKGALTVSTENCYLEKPLRGYQTVKRGEYVKLQIADEGTGIQPEHLDQIFDPFFTTKKMDRKRGSGLGLSVVHGILEDHDGYVLVDTKPRKGTTFSLFFPVTRDLEKELAKVAEKSKGGDERILIVDDDPIQRRVARLLLKRLGYKVNVVASGERAVMHIKKRPYDLLLMDMVMDGIDGAETYRQILEIEPGQKAIILSGYAMSNRVEEALKLGAGAFVAKPVTQKVLANAVRRELDRKRRRRRHRALQPSLAEVH